MESGYKILWTDHALKELDKTYDYLKTHFTEREMKSYQLKLTKRLN
jgi:plasmid stabilization system protein ParE